MGADPAPDDAAGDRPSGDSAPDDAATDRLVPEYGETWVYESIFGALPGIDISERLALAIQFSLFEAGVLILAWYYGLADGAVAGTAAVVVATAGSVEMLRISKHVRRADPPEPYRRLLFGSSIEVVLGVLAFVALLTYLFVVDPRSARPLVTDLLGPEPPLAATYLTLLVLWDVCYRIGTGWWASVAALWRSVRFRFSPEQTRALARADLETMGFGVLQLLLVPFLVDHTVLLVAVVGHVLAVATVTTLSLVVLYSRTEGADAITSSP
ncbi:DUF7530 family protein [Halosimplex pelagicum]|uniref:DUF7530 family protein n=1 Tax=Halosimplex pelagicum TaxID=869886 RepID=UPI001FE849BD|nr:hypothetical protein [Halosimplex pelagicum]